MRLWPLAFLVLLPAAAGQGTVTPDEVDTTLYLHVINVQDIPINTQEPSPDHWDEGRFGFGTNTLTCVHAATGGQGGGTTGQAYHTFHGYSSASYVEYDFTENGAPYTHPERLLGYDVPLVGGEASLHWYMAGFNGDDRTSSAPSVTPNVVVTATVRASDAVSVDDKAYDAGEVLLEGRTQPVTLAGPSVTGPGASQVTVDQVDGRSVYGFRVPLEVLGRALPGTRGYTLRIDVHLDVPCDEGSLMTNSLAVQSDPAHWPRIELRNGEPLRVTGADAFQSDDLLMLRWNVISAWGNYDVAVDRATVELLGPAEVMPTLNHTIQRYHEHYHLADPVEQAWTVPLAQLPDGHYTALFRVPNLQGTATAEARVSFTIQDGRVVERVQAAPAAPLALVGLALLGAALLRRA